MHSKRYISLILYIISVTYGHSQNAYDLSINDSITEHNFVLSELHVYVDSTNQLKINDVLKDHSDDFNIYPEYIKNDYDINATYWVRLDILHNSNSKRIWLIEFFDQTIDSITIFKPGMHEAYLPVRMGDQMAFGERALKHKNFLFILDNSNDSISHYYFKINSANKADVRIVLRSLNQFVYYALNEYFIFGIFYGLIFIISVYNLLLFFAIRERKYIVYMFYLLSVGLYAMCTDGIAFQYLWPSHPVWNQFSSGFFIYLVVMCALIFTRLFLKTKERSPIFDKTIVAAMVIRSGILLYTIFFSSKLFDNRFIEIVPISIMLLASISVKWGGYKPARFIVLGYSLLMIGIVIKSLVYAGLIPFSIATNYSLRIGFILEMLFLTIALGERVKTLKQNRDKAMLETIKEHEVNVQLLDKVNAELEAKVMERTIELNKKNQLMEQTNQKLISQAQEIHQINSVLDLDNWKLKNNLKNVVQDRIFNKYLTYDEFRSVFPDHLACYRYLENSKWADDYACKKCNNKKYSSSHTSFSRRCSKCGYNESITAFTIFHGIKFPIEKAFYITFRVTRGRKDYTLDELAQTLDLRKNTVWKFKQKVELIIKDSPKQRQNYQIVDDFVPSV